MNLVELEMLRVDRCRDMQELVNFWARSGSQSGCRKRKIGKSMICRSPSNRYLTQSRLQVTWCTAERYCLLHVVVQGPGSFVGPVDFSDKTLTTTPSQFVLTNHVRRPSIRIYKGLKSDQHIQIITKLALNWISGILRMKSYIENELKRNKIPKNYNTTKVSNRRPMYQQANWPFGGRAAKHWYKLHHVSVYIQRAWVIARLLVSIGFRRVPVRRFSFLYDVRLRSYGASKLPNFRILAYFFPHKTSLQPMGYIAEWLRFFHVVVERELWSLLTTYRKLYIGFSKNALLDP